jgi:hypothetical protein
MTTREISDREIWTALNGMVATGPVPAVELAARLVQWGYQPAGAAAMADKIQPALDRMVSSGHIKKRGPRFSTKQYSTEGCSIPASP